MHHARHAEEGEEEEEEEGKKKFKRVVQDPAAKHTRSFCRIMKKDTICKPILPTGVINGFITSVPGLT